MLKRLLTLLLLLAPSVLAQNPVSGGPIPQSTYTTSSTIGGGLPTGCTSPGTGAITCTGTVAANSVTSTTNKLFNVKDPLYGAVGDAKYSSKVNASNGVATLTDATDAPWLSTDCNSGAGCTGPVNKFISCTDTATNLKGLVTVVSTITGFTSSSSITVSSNSAAALTNAACTWFTQDDTSSMLAAFTAARAGATQADTSGGLTSSPALTYPGSVYCPPGGYAVSGIILNQVGTNVSPEPGVSFIGAGRSACKIYLLPSMSGGLGLMYWNNASGFVARDFAVNGMDFNFHNFVANGLIELNNVADFRLQDFDVVQFGDNLSADSSGGGASVQIANLGLQITGVVDGLRLTNPPSISTNAAIWLNVVNGVTFSNNQVSFQNMSVYALNSGGRGTSVNGEFPLTFINNNFQECSITTGCITLVGSGINVIGGWNLALTGGYAFSLDTTSSMNMSDSECVAFDSVARNMGCFLMTGAAQLHLRGNTLLGNGNLRIVNAPSTAGVFDDGGNSWQNCQTGTCTVITPANTATYAYTGGVVPVFHPTIPAIVTVTIGSGADIAATSLCPTANCPAGTYRVNVYIDLTTPCGTTGTFIPWLGYTDDSGARTGSSTTTFIDIAGTGSVPSTGTLTTTSTSNFGQGTYILRTTGAATGGLGSINYGATRTACGTAGPMVGQMYLSVEAIQTH